MKGEENGFDEIVEAKGILNELNILPSVVLLLKYGDVYLPTVQAGCQFYLDVGELQLIVEVYLVDAQFLHPSPQNLVDLPQQVENVHVHHVVVDEGQIYITVGCP